MATYSYRVKDRAGNTRTGTLEAKDERHAASMIREAGGYPMDIRLVHEINISSDALASSAFARYIIHPIWTGISIKALLFFYRQLATMLGAGMSLSEALRSVSERARGPIGRIVRQMHSRVQTGGRLSDEMIKHPRVFAPLQVSLIRAGEQSGLLEQMANKIASHLEFEIGLRRKITTAILYPMLILLFIAVEPAIIVLVLDGFQACLKVLYGEFKMFGVPLIIMIIAFKLLFQFSAVRFMWDLVKIQPPILGTVARKIAMARFSSVLALLYSSGVPIAQAVSISADACANIAIGHSLKQTIPAINNGESLTDSLGKTKMLLPAVVDMLYVGEKSGSYDLTLNKVADYMEDEANTTLKKLPVMLFVIMMIIAGIIAGMQIIGGYSGYVNKTIGPNL